MKRTELVACIALTGPAAGFIFNQPGVDTARLEQDISCLARRVYKGATGIAEKEG